MDPSAATASGSVTFIRPLFLCLVHPRDNKAIEVVDISRVPASAQMEFSTLLLLQILIKALTSQQWTHCLGKSKQFLAAFQGPGGPPELGHGAVGSTSAPVALRPLCSSWLSFAGSKVTAALSQGREATRKARTPLFAAGPPTATPCPAAVRRAGPEERAGTPACPGRKARQAPARVHLPWRLQLLSRGHLEASRDTEWAETAVLPEPHLPMGC